jgi:hypothetical protein
LLGDKIHHKHKQMVHGNHETMWDIHARFEKIGMDVSHVQMGDMRSIYKQHMSKLLTSKGNHIIHRVNGIITGREGEPIGLSFV